jgi:hypothetical protein
MGTKDCKQDNGLQEVGESSKLATKGNGRAARSFVARFWGLRFRKQPKAGRLAETIQYKALDLLLIQG